MSTITLSKAKWDKIERFMEAVATEWISEKQAAELIGVTVRTLQTRVYKKNIPDDCYRYAINNARVYNKLKLLNLTA